MPTNASLLVLLVVGGIPLWGQQAYVADSASNTVSVINTATNTVVGAPIPVGNSPVSIALTPDGSRAYVINSFQSTVSVINTATNTVVGASIPVPNSPSGIAVTPDGTRAYVASRDSDTVSVINTAINMVVGMPIPVGNDPVGIAITPDGTRAYVTNDTAGTVSVINTTTNTVVGAPIAVGLLPIAVAITPDGTRAYVTNYGSNTVSVINTATNTVVGAPISVGAAPAGIAITPDGTRAYVTNRASSTVSVIDTATNMVVGGEIPVGLGPFGIAITPDGTRAYVVNNAAGTVSVINTVTNTVVGVPISVGTNPFGIAIAVVPAVAPTISKSFNPPGIPVFGISALSFTVTNANRSAAASGVSFTDNLPTGVIVATPSALTGSCGGGAIAAVPGSSSISLTGATLIAGGTCTFSVAVTATTAGVKNNITGAITSTNQGTGGTASATLTALSAAPLLTKTFGGSTVTLNENTSLAFTLTNPNPTPLTGLTFTDNLPLGLRIATPNGLVGACGGGTITALPGSGTISLAGATLAGGASCTFTVNVTAIALGQQTNTTGTVASNQATAGAAATATVDVIGDPFKVNYLSNLNIGDSVVNITNSGSLGAALQAGTTAATTGAVCANVYVFSPDEQMVACCSCPVTPNGLVSLSGKNDLISNTLTPAVPTSLVVKLLATAPIGGTCNNSAAGVTSATLAPGMVAWGTALHANTTSGTYRTTERAFVPATLSTGELNRLATACNFILSIGSGFGQCRSCRLGGLGGDRR